MSSLEPTYPCLRAPSCPPGLSEGTVPAPVKLPSTASPGLEPGRPLTPQDTARGTNGKGASQRTTPAAGMSLLSPSTGSGGPALSSQGQAACQPQKPDLGLGRLAARLLDQTTGHHHPPSAAVCLAASRPGQARRCGIRPMGGTPWLHGAQPAGPAGPQPTWSLPIRHSPPPSAALPDDAGLSQRLQEDMATSLPTRGGGCGGEPERPRPC